MILVLTCKSTRRPTHRKKTCIYNNSHITCNDMKNEWFTIINLVHITPILITYTTSARKWLEHKVYESTLLTSGGKRCGQWRHVGSAVDSDVTSEALWTVTSRGNHCGQWRTSKALWAVTSRRKRCGQWCHVGSAVGSDVMWECCGQCCTVLTSVS